jgi:Domain of unknown function (DUF1906)/S-layer homology domain
MSRRSGVRSSLAGDHRRRVTVSLCVGAIVSAALVVSIMSHALATTPRFPDVPVSNPYYAAITDLASRGITGGFPDGTFGPNKPVLRKQFAKMIVGAMGLTVTEDDWQDSNRPFTDCGRDDPNSLYPHDYIAVAKAHNLAAGETPTTFAPHANITRAQMVTMVVRAAQNSGITLTPVGPDYVGTFTAYADPTHGANVHLAEYNKLLQGFLVTGDPSAWMAANATRGEVAQVLWKLMQLRTSGVAGDITRYGVDYSMTKVDWPTYFGALKASGRDFIGRYLPWKGSAWRQVTAVELKAAAVAGVDYFFWFEDSDNHFRARDGGFAAGAADAQEALRSLASLGLPTTTPVYYTVDFPCPDGSQIDAYFRGINSVVPVSQIGAYGNYTTIDWLYQHGLATYFCESNAWPEPQGWHPQAQMHQYASTYSIGGVSVDRLTVTAADFGQCRRHEEFDPRFYYSGSWTPSSTPAGVYSGGACEYSAAAGASVTVGFYGTSLDWIATKSPDGGSASVSLDGADATTISLYSATPQYQQKAWSSGPLSSGPHILTIRQNTGGLNVDAFDIAGSLIQYTQPNPGGR